jgi:DNA-binding MltR family transcriptional regulator
VNTANNLLEDGRPLGNAGAQNDVAYSLGLTSKLMHKNISIVFDVRNLFAHSHRPLEFSSKRVAEECDKIEFGAVVVMWHEDAMDTLQTNDPRRKFERIVATLATTIKQLTELTEQSKVHEHANRVWPS